MIHTSCRSESSNISLVVLDKLSLCPNAPRARLHSVMHFPGNHSELVKWLRLSPGFSPSGRRPTCLGPQTWWGTVLDPWTVRKTETSASSVPTAAGHLSGEIGTNSLLASSLENIFFFFVNKKTHKYKRELNNQSEKGKQKCLQHHVFPGGHPSKY